MRARMALSHRALPLPLLLWPATDAGVALSIVLWMRVTMCATAAQAAAFKSMKECTAGRRVANQSNEPGVITGVSNSASLCQVKMDQRGDVHHFLFWMLHDVSGSKETDDKLVSGKYACRSFSRGQMSYDFIDVVVTGPTTYVADGKNFRFHLDPNSRQITFENGPFVGKPAKLADGPSIDFSATSCNLEK
jgi:hypothetical protein